jgi:hypothetical protein
MEAIMAVTEALPARTPDSAPRNRVRIDWKRGAALLIDGETPSAVCAALGIDDARLWRHLRSSLRFQYLLRQARERRQLLGQIRLEAASREAVVRLARSAEKPEAALIAELGATGHGTGEPQDDGRDVIARLAGSGRRPPNQAWRRRIAAERRQMDAEAAEARQFLTALQAQRPAPQVPAPAPAPASAPVAEPPRGLPDTAATASAKPGISPDKTQISPDKTQISADKPAPAPDRPPRRTLPLAPLQASGAIVDLTDMYGNPLNDTGAG